MNSRLYRGVVWHTRSEPAYRFQYRVWYLCLDLSERDSVASKLRLLSRNRQNVTSFWDRDYLALDSSTAPPAEAGGIERSQDRTELITVPRIFGHAFNPASFLIERKDDAITGVRIEVHNTWGERHVYVLERHTEADPASRERNDDGAPATPYRSGTEKAFYVSPFLPMEGGYNFELREDQDGRLRVQIRLTGSEGEQLFAAGIDVRPLMLSDANLARLLVAYPFVNLKTVAMIHWQGVKLWLKGVKFRANPSRVGKKGKQLWPKGH